jgi:hypothetical protein
MYPDSFSTGYEAHQMIKPRSSRISLVTLLLCICFGSLVILPMLNIVDLSAPEISGVDLGNYNLLDQVEFDEEILVLTIVGSIIAYKFFSKSGPKNLGFQTTYLSPVSPPPKNS